MTFIPPPSSFILSLGSNLGDRLAHLQAAARAIAALPGTRVLAAAPVYETDPVDCPPGSQAFYNTVIEIASDLAPLPLLRQLRAIETALGRPGDHPRHAPRTVDIDMLCAGSLILDHPELTLPHPRLHLRRFVLQPLADLAPRLQLPGQHETIAGLLHHLDSAEPPLRPIQDRWLPT